MLYTDLTKKALKISFAAHKDQKDKSGMPYVYHPFHLAEQMDDEYSVCVALLHDVIEDTDITADDLRAEDFPQEVLDALLLMTHDDSVPYMDYVRKIRENPIAAKVKMADLRHNSDLSRLDHIDGKALERKEKYEEAMRILKDTENELLADVKAFCEKNIVLMELLYTDKELNEWCSRYSAYQKIETHTGLQDYLYGDFVQEAYAFMPMILQKRDYSSYRFEEALSGSKFDLAFGICLEIRGDYASGGSLIFSAIAEGHLYRLMAAFLGIEAKDRPPVAPAQTNEGSLEKATENKQAEEVSVKPSQNTLEALSVEEKPYSIAYMKRYEGVREQYLPGSRTSYFDRSLNKWRLRVQLDDERIWFLSVFVNADGTLDKYSLDKELAEDSHYEFSAENSIRTKIYHIGDSQLSFDQVLTRYVKEHGGDGLLKLIRPYITAQYHFD